MHRPQAGIGESHATVEACQCHVGAGGWILRGMNRLFERSQGSGNALAAASISERVGTPRDKGLDELRQGIQTGGSGERGRQRAGKGWIHQCHGWQHGIVSEAYFHPMVGRGNDRVARDFRSRSSCGGHRNHWKARERKRLSATNHFQIIHERTRLGRHDGQGLGGIQDTSAPEAEHPVKTLPHLKNPPFDVFHLGFGSQFKKRGLLAALIQKIETGLNPLDTPAAHHQDTISIGTHSLTELCKGTPPKPDRGCSGEGKSRNS